MNEKVSSLKDTERIRRWLEAYLLCRIAQVHSGADFVSITEVVGSRVRVAHVTRKSVGLDYYDI